MKKYIYIAAMLLTLAACNKVGPEQDSENGLQEMSFVVNTGTLTRAGIYNSMVYPSNRLYLTAFYEDGYTKEGQYYFEDLPIDKNAAGKWVANNWMWPLQGKMYFVSYHCPGYSQAPVFDTIYNADGTSGSRMTVDLSGANAPDVLDGKTDFLYLAHTTADCPASGDVTLTFDHGLAWIVVTIQRTTEAANTKLKKVIIEDCSRKGIASIVSGKDLTWTIDPNDINDQIAGRYETGPGSINFTNYWWKEEKDGNQTAVLSNSNWIPKAKTTLGTYTPDSSDHIGEGLLIVPQRKTAITVHYQVVIGSETFDKVQRFELRDNDEQWRPGIRYQYDILFTYQDSITSADLVETWTYINTDGNPCYDEGGDAGGIIIDHVHDGGSGTGDDMDYIFGGYYS